MVMASKKIKWNQTEEGRRKQAQVMKEVWAKKRGLKSVPITTKQTDENNLIRSYQTLQQKAEDRLNEIDKEIDSLNEEKHQLLRVFKSANPVEG